MNGLLEQILAALQANTLALQANTAVNGAGVSSAAQLSAVVAPAQLTAAVAPAVAQVTDTGQAITAEAITAMIQPHIANEAIKGALGAAMRAMGINALPETQPHQFGQLYASFKAVLAQHGVGAAPAASAASII